MSYYNYTPTITQAATAAGQFVSHGADMVANIMMDTAKTNAQGTMAMATTVAGILQSGAERRARAAIASAQIQAQMITAKMNQSLEYARLASANANAAKERALKEREMASADNARSDAMAAQKARDDFAIMDANRKQELAEYTSRVNEGLTTAQEMRAERESAQKHDIELKKLAILEKKDKDIDVDLGKKGGASTGASTGSYKIRVGGTDYTKTLNGDIVGMAKSQLQQGAKDSPSASMSPGDKRAYVAAFVANTPSVRLPNGDKVFNPSYVSPDSMSKADKAARTDAMKVIDTAKAGGNGVLQSFTLDTLADKIVKAGKVDDGLSSENDDRFVSAVTSNSLVWGMKERDQATGEIIAKPVGNDYYDPLPPTPAVAKKRQEAIDKLASVAPSPERAAAMSAEAQKLRDPATVAAVDKARDEKIDRLSRIITPPALRVVSESDYTVQKMVIKATSGGEIVYANIATPVTMPKSTLFDVMTRVGAPPEKSELAVAPVEPAKIREVMASTLASDAMIIKKAADEAGATSLFGPAKTPQSDKAPKQVYGMNLMFKRETVKDDSLSPVSLGDGDQKTFNQASKLLDHTTKYEDIEDTEGAKAKAAKEAADKLAKEAADKAAADKAAADAKAVKDAADKAAKEAEDKAAADKAAADVKAADKVAATQVDATTPTAAS